MRQDQLEMLKGLWDREGVPYECGTPLARYTTFKIGGPAALFARPADARQLEAALAACKKSDVRYYLLGQGSNTLFADEGFDGAVICTRMMGDVPRIEGERMTAPAGAGLTALCAMARDAGLDRVYFHIIFDGRSTEPGSAPAMLTELDEKLDAIGVGRIVDGVGRGVALDRDKNYDKVKRAYDAMVDGAGTLYE